MEQKPVGTAAFPREDGENPPAPPIVISRPTWATWVFFFACVGIFVGINLQDSDKKYTWAVLERFGFFPAHVIWEGAWWGAVTSAFVHINLIHAFFNLYWLWNLGRLMENEIGSWRFFVFYLGAAIVSSTAQLAVSDQTGIGASGAVYALFGFMWRTRMVYPKFQRIMVPQTIKTFFVWLVACFVLTAADIMKIANGAHVAGLIYGAVVAECFVIRRPRVPYAIGATALAALSLVPLWWAPWSNTWQGVKAQGALEADKKEVAIVRLSIIIERDPKNAWAYRTRGRLYRQLGESDKAAADFQQAQELSSSATDQE
jgi:membrane associated rhomboid family serine protease